MIKLPEIALSQALHGAARVAFERAGYRWEVRRAGEVGVGAWRIRLNRHSSARKLVVVPGFGDTSLSWLPSLIFLRPMLPSFYDELVFLDFPGFHGFLGREKCVPTMDLLLKVTSDVFDSYKPHTLIGHSLGGWLSAHYAMKCGLGERPLTGKKSYSGPKNLVLLSPSGIFGTPSEKEAFQAKFKEAAEHGFERFKEHLFAEEPIWFRWVKKDFTEFFKREDILQFMQSVRDDHDLVEHASAIQAKVWLIWGEEDRLVPASWATDWLRILGPEKATAILLRKTGHSIQLERPMVTAAVLAQVLAGRVPDKRGKLWWHLEDHPSSIDV